MIALCVDDENILLQVLKKAVEASPDIREAVTFTSGNKALEWAGNHSVDIAFLDIQIHQMSGIDLAQELKKIHPHLPIVFCTGYDNYAMEAFKVHAAGYLTKPIYAKDVQEQIDYIKELQGIASEAKKEKRLRVECFGNFEVYHNEKPLEFKRKKSKELLAYLIDRQGAAVSIDQIVAVLWEDKLDNKNLKNYFYQILHHLKTVLKEAGYDDLILNVLDGYAVNKEYIDCDYYRYLHEYEKAVELFQGEYMFQYSWAEETCGQLTQMLYNYKL